MPARTPTLAVAIVCALLASACTGSIEGHAESDLMVPGGGGGPALPGDNMHAPSDDEVRAEDPELFDTATEYFPGQAAQAGEKRLFRLTRTQLDLTTQTLLPKAFEDSVKDSVPSDPLQTNYEFGENLSWNASNLTPYAAWVAGIATRASAMPADVIACASATDTACLEREAERFLRRAFRNVLRDEQRTRFQSYFVASAAAQGLSPATAELIDLALTSPSYVFRDEVSTDAAGNLLPAQALQNLSYALADAPPEALGLPETAVSADVLDSVLASPLAREKLVRFFLAWLEVKEPAEFMLAANVFPEWTAEVASAAVADTRAFLDNALAQPAPSLAAITQSSSAYVSGASAFLYGETGSGGPAPITLDPNERIGIFTQPAVIASHSGPTTTRLVKRGVFFTRKVMCLPLGAPPDGVNTMVPEMPGATERQRIESITSVQPCIGCHTFINPFGFMQEGYDAIGRLRDRDEEGLAIDASISVEFLDEGPLMTMTGVEALRALTGSARFQQCFTRQLFRFYMGRDEETGDDPVLRQMFFAFAQDGKQDILAALRALAGSSSFHQRTETAP